VLEFWTIDRGRIRQGRLSREWQYVQAKRAKAKAAIEGRWNREKGYGRNTDVCSDEIHLGGGGGVGILAGKEKSCMGDTPARDDEPTPFDVIRGGRA